MLEPVSVDPTTRRSLFRQPVVAQAVLRQSGAQGSSIQLLDISERGCRVSLLNKVAPGTRLWIRLPGLEAIEAVVRWEGNFMAGLEFSRPLYPPVLAHLLARLS